MLRSDPRPDRRQRQRWERAACICATPSARSAAITIDLGFTEIRDFVEANPDEVVTVVIEDYVPPGDIAAAAERTGLIDFVYEGPVGEPWPTLQQMIDSGGRVLMMAENEADTSEFPWYHPAYESLVQETPYSFGRPAELTAPALLEASCAPNRGSPDAAVFLVNHWIDTSPAPRPTNAAKVNKRSALLDRIHQCEEQRDLTATLIAIDFFKEGDLFGSGRGAQRRALIRGFGFAQLRVVRRGLAPPARLGDRREVPDLGHQPHRQPGRVLAFAHAALGRQEERDPDARALREADDVDGARDGHADDRRLGDGNGKTPHPAAGAKRRPARDRALGEHADAGTFAKLADRLVQRARIRSAALDGYLAHAAQDRSQAGDVPQARFRQRTDLAALAPGHADRDGIPLRVVVADDQDGSRRRQKLGALDHHAAPPANDRRTDGHDEAVGA